MKVSARIIATTVPPVTNAQRFTLQMRFWEFTADADLPLLTEMISGADTALNRGMTSVARYQVLATAPETSVSFYETTRRNVPEKSYLKKICPLYLVKYRHKVSNVTDVK
jgi:hypothetical protein